MPGLIGLLLRVSEDSDIHGSDKKTGYEYSSSLLKLLDCDLFFFFFFRIE